MHVCMCVCVFMNMYVCMRVNIHLWMCVFVWMCVNIYVCEWMCKKNIWVYLCLSSHFWSFHLYSIPIWKIDSAPRNRVVSSHVCTVSVVTCGGEKVGRLTILLLEDDEGIDFRDMANRELHVAPAAPHWLSRIISCLVRARWRYIFIDLHLIQLSIFEHKLKQKNFSLERRIL